LLYASVDAGSTSRYTPSTTIATLDKLLQLGHLSAAEYIELLPPGVISNRETILEKFYEKGASKNE
jgi:hypothetical protein